MLIGAPQVDDFGFSITSAIKKVGNVVYQAHAIPTRAAMKALKDPRVQQAAVAAGQSYVSSQGGGQYAQYIQQARSLLPGSAPPPPPPGAMMPDGGDDADTIPASAGPVQKGNFMTIAAIAGAGLIIFLLLRK